MATNNEYKFLGVAGTEQLVANIRGEISAVNDSIEETVNAAADSKFYVVTFDLGDDHEYHSDLTFAEIREKFEAGGNMVARIDGTDYIPLLSAAEHQIIFSGIYQATSVSLTIDKNDVCTLSSTSLSRSNHNHGTASETSSGFMSKEDKAKLNNLDSTIEAAVASKQDTLTGTEGQIIQFDASGKPVAVNFDAIKSIVVNGESAPIVDGTVSITIPEVEQVQPDWNQNDETAADYIKNRPFYDNTEVLVDNITVNNGDTLDFAVDSFGNTGDTVSIIWDGVLTDKTIGYCIAISGRWHIPYNTIGNQSYISDTFDEGGDNTGEDYVIYGGPGVSTSTIICDDQSHTLSIVREVLTQIDEKFIPDTIAKKSYVDKKVDEVVANIPSVTDVETKLPITLGAFQYFKWGELPGDSIEEQAQHLARYDVIVYQGALCDSLSMSATDYERDLALYTKALEYNPDLKVFGYVTARGFANSTAGLGHVGMEEYRVSPDNVDYPIWTKEELCAYINLMAHCGGTRNTSVTDEFGNPTLTGGIPLYGVFFDDYDYNFEDDNTHLLNQGDWSSIREKHNFLIDYCHSLGLSVMPNSNPTLIFDNAATPDSVRNPDGIASHMTEDDWFCVESYFLRSDYTFGSHDNWVTTYNNTYRDTYKSKCLTLSYTYAVSDDAADNEQIANTFAIYQALCQGADSIALHGSTLFTEIPDELAKYYDKNNNAVRTSGNGYYSLTVNGHTITASRSAAATAYGSEPNSKTLATCKVTIDGQHVFNNMYVKHEELVYDFAEFKSGVDAKVDGLVSKVEQSSNLYQRVFIDDWVKNFDLADYTNHSATFKNAYGGEDTGTTSSWSNLLPYCAKIYLPKQYSWRRIEMNVSHLAGKTVELGFDRCDMYLDSEPDTKLTGAIWYVDAVCDSNSNLRITSFTPSVYQESVIDGVTRCCTKFTFPEDVQSIKLWIQRTSATPEGTWVVDIVNVYLVDVNEFPIQKTWFTNYAPSNSAWDVMGSNSRITYDNDTDSITVNYTATNNCYETRMRFPANTGIFKPGETWELGFKDLRLRQPDTGLDVTSKLIILFNLSGLLPNFVINGKSYYDYQNMKSEVEEGRIAIARFTVPEGYSGGMAQTPLYIYPSGYVGGDANGLYELYVEGLYLYKLDERDELVIRGEDPSDTYISLNRITKDNTEENLKPDSVYFVDDGTVFATNFRGERVKSENASTLPAVSIDNNGAFLRVVDGVWTAVNLTDVSTEGA